MVDLAGLKAGERVLVHAATGGVGMAAVQIAKYLGAEVFATASPGKWDTLRALGVEESHIASSRTLEFKERFLGQTDGSGVDVVLDSLAGEFVDASLGLLVNGGRFIEMGKADVRDPEGVAEECPGVSYRAFDLLEAGLDRVQEMFCELCALIEHGELRELPVISWDMRRAPEAFRFMSQARHVGKIVLTAPRGIDPQGTVLVTAAPGGWVRCWHAISWSSMAFVVCCWLVVGVGGAGRGGVRARAAGVGCGGADRGVRCVR